MSSRKTGSLIRGELAFNRSDALRKEIISLCYFFVPTMPTQAYYLLQTPKGKEIQWKRFEMYFISVPRKKKLDIGSRNGLH